MAPDYSHCFMYPPFKGDFTALCTLTLGLALCLALANGILANTMQAET